MTEATITIRDVDLEAWLAGEIERPCEMRAVSNRPESACGRPAEWIVYATFPGGCPPASRFLCDWCRDAAVRGLTACCSEHKAISRITWIERARS